MDTYDVLLIVGVLCGLVMIVGGILLLYKGAISLTNVTKEEALTIEFKKELRISTQYPALGIFVIGLFFIIFSVWMGKPEIKKITLKAKTVDVTEPVSITIKSSCWKSNFEYTGDIVETFYPNIETIQIELSAPGYEPKSKTLKLSSLIGNTADLGEIKLTQKLSKINVDSRNIAPLPDNVQIPSFSDSNKFGESK